MQLSSLLKKKEKNSKPCLKVMASTKLVLTSEIKADTTH